ncbi:MAG TPA: gamma-glutamyltransferase [Gaiellaceae bacterium]|nr:gamma-glutamyltransferase [Gaiellaceae bacterium]
MKGAVAAGHPLTAAAGARVLAEGGNAVDACVAAAFAAWVAESPLTGPGAGGFALVLPADGRSARLADFFVAVPGLGLPAGRRAEMHAVDVGFGDSETTQVFRIGEPSCAVPGAAAGLEAVHRAYGRLPWRELLAPAAELARTGVELTREQAHLHAILDLILRHQPEGARLYSGPDGLRLQPGDTLRMPDLAATLDALAADGAAAIYRGDVARAIVETVRGGGGHLTLDDLARYRVVWRRPVRVPYLGHEVISNPPPSSGGILIAYGLSLLERMPQGPPGSAAAISALALVLREQARVRDASFTSALQRGGLARRLLSPEGIRTGLAALRAEPVLEPAPPGGTTHVSVVDGDGNAASLTSSTGSGSGVLVPGTGIQLNNMLGEYDLAAGRSAPGVRLTSMMAPTVVTREGRPRLVVGSAGSIRLRGAITQVIANVVAHGLGVAEAIDRPRVHAEGAHLHCEGGIAAAELDRLEELGFDVVRWRRRNLYFGGTNAVEVRADGSLAAAGDARRGGAGLVVGS